MYACPTTKASFGITLLESMACETPVVCSDILGFRDVVKDGREALMVPCGDKDALADAIVQPSRRRNAAYATRQDRTPRSGDSTPGRASQSACSRCTIAFSRGDPAAA